MEIKKTQDLSSTIYRYALDIRREVFVQEQRVPLKLEIDDDEGNCIHFVLYTQAQIPTATLRILPAKDNQSVLIQRVATLKAHRGKGYAAQLLTAALEYLKSQNVEQVELHAQLQAIPFYQKLGFQTYGPKFLDANIPHLTMKKII